MKNVVHRIFTCRISEGIEEAESCRESDSLLENGNGKRPTEVATRIDSQTDLGYKVGWRRSGLSSPYDTGRIGATDAELVVVLSVRG